VPVTGAIVIDGGYDAAAVLAQATAGITPKISAHDKGAAVLCAEIVAAAMGGPGVINYLPTSPASDVAITATSKAIPGAMTITPAG
jgi:hypothetical protein